MIKCPKCFNLIDGIKCHGCGFYTHDIPKPTPDPVLLCGLDVGKRVDHAAFVPLKKGTDGIYDCLSVYQFPLMTPYPRMVASVTKWMHKPPLDKAILVIDRTGAGDAVADMFVTAVAGRSVTVNITGGAKAHQETQGDFLVPKAQLGSTVAAVLGQRRIRFNEEMQGLDVLRRELETFVEKVTRTGQTTYEAEKAKDHDDVVLALAIALWLGEYGYGPADVTENPEAKMAVMRAPAGVFGMGDYKEEYELAAPKLWGSNG